MGSIFSTYSTRENRVTASCLAVLRSLSLDRIQRLLGALLEQSEFELVRFENQPSKGGTSVPDAIIHSSIRLLVETKIARNSINLFQIKQHLERLDRANEATRLLLVITPDDARPEILDSLNDDRVVWSSFVLLDQAIDDIIDDKYEVISEREEYLLRELQNMLAAERLLASVNDVVVVAARNAWPEYNEVHAYICQPNRPFQQVKRIAFYSKGVVNPLVPTILESYDDVTMTMDGHSSEMLGKLVQRLLNERRRAEGDHYKVLLLSAPDSPDTIRLPESIPNDMKSKSGKPTAFTMGQRYIASHQLMSAKTTTDLVDQD